LQQTLQIPTAEVFSPLLAPSRYKAAHGGRGSGKSRFFAGLAVEEAIAIPGYRIMCGREIQKSTRESSKRLIEDTIARFNAGDYFDVQDQLIKTRTGGLFSFVGLQDHTAESIKSYEGYHRAWIEEAQSLSAKSNQLLRPTIREAGSEIWYSWNPRFDRDPVDEFFRKKQIDDAISVVANWRDNPWFPAELEAERQIDLRENPDDYDHVWEGGYVRIYKGAYYAKFLAEAEKQGRIGNVARDPLMQVRCYWDIGGTSRQSDATAIWVVQFVGLTIRLLNYYEAIGQELGEHVQWLRDNDYASALQVLPHDAGQHEKIERRTYETALRDAGFTTRVIGNIGTGAAKIRIDAARRLLPSMWFDKATEHGRKALAAYHEKWDETRGLGLGPNHDWASHGADAFGLMALDYEPPTNNWQPLKYKNIGIR
jgi:phage terminase large subunit